MDDSERFADDGCADAERSAEALALTAEEGEVSLLPVGK
jgi:hypothetical protein